MALLLLLGLQQVLLVLERLEGLALVAGAEQVRGGRLARVGRRVVAGLLLLLLLERVAQLVLLLWQASVVAVGVQVGRLARNRLGLVLELLPVAGLVVVQRVAGVVVVGVVGTFGPKAERVDHKIVGRRQQLGPAGGKLAALALQQQVPVVLAEARPVELEALLGVAGDHVGASKVAAGGLAGGQPAGGTCWPAESKLAAQSVVGLRVVWPIIVVAGVVGWPRGISG